LAVVVRDANDAISMQDLEGQILAWNPAAERLYGWTEAEALKMNVSDRIPMHLRENEMLNVLHLSQSIIMKPFRTQRLKKEGAIIDILMTATALLNQAGEIYAIATTERIMLPTTDDLSIEAN
jgi:two-component system CheB/CheR fusion protein